MIQLYFPCKPSIRNQGFGSNPDYYARFKDQLGNPMKGHMGIDFFATHGEPVYAAHDGLAQFLRDEHGGEGIYLTTSGFRTVYWHLIGDTDTKLPSPIPTDGHSYPVKTGDLIGYANNTGAPFETTGDHLHFALYELNPNGTVKNIGNGFNGAISPDPYWTGFYATDYPTVLTLYQKAILLAKALLSRYTSRVQ